MQWLKSLECWAADCQAHVRDVAAGEQSELPSHAPAHPAVLKWTTVSRLMATTSGGNFKGTQKDPPTGRFPGNSDTTGKSFHHGSIFFFLKKF